MQILYYFTWSSNLILNAIFSKEMKLCEQCILICTLYKNLLSVSLCTSDCNLLPQKYVSNKKK